MRKLLLLTGQSAIVSLKMTDKGVFVLGCFFCTFEQFEISKVKGCIGVRSQICINVVKAETKIFLFTQIFKKYLV